MASEIKVDTISEKTSANGVTIDSVNIKDGKIATANSIDSDAYVDGSIDTAHIADDQITLAKMASGTDGNIISYDASGNPVAIATGSDGQVLTSTGAGSPPAFEAVSADFVHIKTVTASNVSSVDFVNGTSDVVFDATYTSYQIVINDLVPASDAHVHMRVMQSGSAVTSSDYGFFTHGGGSDVSAGNGNSNADNQAEFKLTGQAIYDVYASGNYFGIINCSKPTTTGHKKFFWHQCFASDADGNKGQFGAGQFNANTSAINGLSFYMDSGNIASGNFSLYGRKTA